MRIEKFVFDAIERYTGESSLSATGVITDEIKRLLKIAYEDGRREGGNEATCFEWGVKCKDVSFEEWLIDLQEELERQ